MRLDPEILDRAPGEGARVVALALCGAAEEAARRVADPADAEALHDLRVALRRLRSALRAWAPALEGSLRPKDLRRLRDLARATGAARDAEVLLAWLEPLRDGLEEPWRPALDWLAARVDAARRDGYARVRDEVAPRFLRRAAGLAQALAAGAAAPARDPEAFGAGLAARARLQAQVLREALKLVGSAADAVPAHQARIEAKRLRYLLEPLRGNARADAGPAVKALRALQDRLGAFHDAHRAEAELAAALVVAAAERARRGGERGEGADLRPGLLALERLARRRSAEAFARLQEDRQAGAAGAALDRAWEVVAALELRDAEEAEPERRLLLAALPEAARGPAEQAEEVEVGWLADGREGYGRVRADGGERWFRTTLQGRGARRLEALEEVGRECFEAYWPLTEGRRVHRRRHRPAAAPGWAFDEFLDRRLALAVAVEGGGAEVPDWLEPEVVRDVSRERGYADDALARRPSRASAPSPSASPSPSGEPSPGRPSGT